MTYSEANSLSAEDFNKKFNIELNRLALLGVDVEGVVIKSDDNSYFGNIKFINGIVEVIHCDYTARRIETLKHSVKTLIYLPELNTDAVDIYAMGNEFLELAGDIDCCISIHVGDVINLKCNHKFCSNGHNINVMYNGDVKSVIVNPQESLQSTRLMFKGTRLGTYCVPFDKDDGTLKRILFSDNLSDSDVRDLYKSIINILKYRVELNTSRYLTVQLIDENECVHKSHTILSRVYINDLLHNTNLLKIIGKG